MYHVRIDSTTATAFRLKPEATQLVQGWRWNKLSESVASAFRRKAALTSHAEATASDSAVRAGVNERRPIVRNAMPARTHSTPAIQNAGS